MGKYMRISEAAERLHVSRFTLRNYAREGKIHFDKTPGGQYVFTQEQLDEFLGIEHAVNTDTMVFYIRDSAGHDGNLKAQQEKLTQLYGQPVKIYKDKASGLNEKRPGLKRLIEDCKHGRVETICITAKDRLTRFGYYYLEELFGLCGAKIMVLDSNIEKTPYDELMQDFMSLIASFSGKFYRVRSNQHKKMLLEKAAKELEEEEQLNG